MVKPSPPKAPRDPQTEGGGFLFILVTQSVVSSIIPMRIIAQGARFLQGKYSAFCLINFWGRTPPPGTRKGCHYISPFPPSLALQAASWLGQNPCLYAPKGYATGVVAALAGAQASPVPDCWWNLHSLLTCCGINASPLAVV